VSNAEPPRIPLTLAHSWTQPQCEACWVRAHSDTDEHGIELLTKVPAILAPDEGAPILETCCYCGALTFVGIYINVDPATVPYPRSDAAAAGYGRRAGGT
jgi:hypothetical protein